MVSNLIIRFLKNENLEGKQLVQKMHKFGIYLEYELGENPTIRKFRIVQKEALKGIKPKGNSFGFWLLQIG